MGTNCYELDLPHYKNSLREAVGFLNNLQFSAVKTKYNAKGDWDAVSIRGYSDDILNILKPGVLKSDVEASHLRWTELYNVPSLLPIKEILSHIPAEFERVRVMRLKAGTKIRKHTDKVDKEIKNKNIIRIHIPLKTSLSDVKMHIWEGKTKESYTLETGKYYYTDVTKPHAVDNNADFDRLHLVVDCYNNPKISQLIDQTAEIDDMDWQYT